MLHNWFFAQFFIVFALLKNAHNVHWLANLDSELIFGKWHFTWAILSLVVPLILGFDFLAQIFHFRNHALILLPSRRIHFPPLQNCKALRRIHYIRFGHFVIKQVALHHRLVCEILFQNCRAIHTSIHIRYI